MPYKSNKDLPDGIKVLPGSAQSIWRRVFNSLESRGTGEESSRKQAWGAVKNAGYHKNKDGNWVKKSKIFKTEVAVTNIDDSLGIVFGWGMVTKINDEPYYDSDNHHFSNEVMIKATSNFMETSRTSNDNHTDVDIGTVIHSFPLSTDIAKSMGISSNINGWMIGIKPNEEVLQKFIDGTYTGFSIDGLGVMEDEDEDDEYYEEEEDDNEV